MNAKKHAKATAAPAKITNKAGTNFLSMVDISQVKIFI